MRENDKKKMEKKRKS